MASACYTLMAAYTPLAMQCAFWIIESYCHPSNTPPNANTFATTPDVVQPESPVYPLPNTFQPEYDLQSLMVNCIDNPWVLIAIIAFLHLFILPSLYQECLQQHPLLESADGFRFSPHDQDDIWTSIETFFAFNDNTQPEAPSNEAVASNEDAGALLGAEVRLLSGETGKEKPVREVAASRENADVLIRRLNQSEKEVERMTEENEGLKGQVSASREQTSDLTNQLTKSEKEIERMGKENDELRGQVSSSKQAADDAREQAEKLSKTSGKLNDENKGLIQRTQTLDEKLNKSHKDIDKLHQIMAAMVGEKANLSDEIASLKKDDRASKKEMTGLANDNERLTNELEKSTDKAENFRERLEKCGKGKESAEMSVDEWKGKAETAEKSALLASGSLDAAQRRNKSYEGTINSNARIMGNLKSENDDKDGKINALEKALADSKAVAAKSNSDERSLRAEAARLRFSLAEEQKVTEQLNEQARTLTLEASEREDTLRRALETLESAEASNKEASSMIASQRSKLEDAQRQISQQKIALDQYGQTISANSSSGNASHLAEEGESPRSDMPSDAIMASHSPLHGQNPQQTRHPRAIHTM